MSTTNRISRRRFLLGVPLGLAPIAALRWNGAEGAAQALLSPADPAARAVKYVEDAKRAPEAGKGNNCANCALYQGVTGSTQGSCQLFPGKDVKAAGWCSSWAAQM